MTNRTISTLIALLVGCTSATDSPSELRLRTTQSEYAPSAVIQVHIENQTTDAMYVSHCNDRVSLLVQRRSGGAWVDYRSAICLAIYPMGELLIASGGTLQESLQIDEPGDYRLQLYARRGHEDFGSTVAYSGAFRVRYPPD